MIDLATLAKEGAITTRVGGDTPAILIDALVLYVRTRDASHAHHLNAYHEEQKRKRQR